MSKGLETLREIGEETIKVNCLAGWVEETVKEAYGIRFDGIEKELKALEIIKKSISSATSLDTLLRELLSNGKINQDEFFLLREALL